MNLEGFEGRGMCDFIALTRIGGLCLDNVLWTSEFKPTGFSTAAQSILGILADSTGDIKRQLQAGVDLQEAALARARSEECRYTRGRDQYSQRECGSRIST
jgi:hypothetical protein